MKRVLLLSIVAALALFSQGKYQQLMLGNADAPQTPTDSPGAGTYSSTQSVTLSDATATVIYYTIDGSTPACPATGTLYTGAISVVTTTTIKAIGCNGVTGGGVLTSVYTITGGGTWTLVQVKYRDSLGGGTGGGTCTNGGTTCNVTVSSVGAGHALVAVLLTGNGSAVTISSINGETFSTCPVSCASGDNTSGWTDARYVTSATGGETSFTVTLSASASGYIGFGIWEFAWSGSSVSVDTSGAADRTSCTTCAGIGLTLSGSSDAIVQAGVPGNSLTAITTYTADLSFPSGAGLAHLINTASGTAPNWTQSPGGTVGVVALALKGN